LQTGELAETDAPAFLKGFVEKAAVIQTEAFREFTEIPALTCFGR
jgi:hypothetical protein